MLSETWWFSNEPGLKHCREYATPYVGLTSLKIQPEKAEVCVVANEAGTILIYDLQSDRKLSQPQQFRVLSFEYGGVTDICWAGSDIFIVGTTRGWLVVFSLRNEKRRMVEVSKAAAHGDGAAQVAVQSIDYCSKSKRVVTVGEGVKSVRLWDINEEGLLTPRLFPQSPTSHLEPRFVAFCSDDSNILVGYLDQITVQKISIETGATAGRQVLGHENGSRDGRHLGNAILLSDGRLVVYNIKNGLDIYHLATFSGVATASLSVPSTHIRFNIDPTSSQGVSTLGAGKFVLSPSRTGEVYIFRSKDSKYSGKVAVSGRSKHIQAIHSITDRMGRDILVSTSSDTQLQGVPGFSHIDVWVGPTLTRSEGKKTRAQIIHSRRDDENRSTFRLVLLCVAVCVIFQLATIFFMKEVMGLDFSSFDERLPIGKEDVNVNADILAEGDGQEQSTSSKTTSKKNIDDIFAQVDGREQSTQGSKKTTTKALITLD